ncbi:MAG: glycosyltransferase [Verrucomicrobiota bacterium]
MRRKLIYFCPETRGGLADYSWAQAEAIARQEVDVLFVTKPGFQRVSAAGVRVLDALKEDPERVSKIRWVRRYRRLQTLIKNMAILRGLILSLHVKEVIWSSFFEYGSPLWAGHFEDLLQHGVRMGVMVHDPIRDYRIGPGWWYRRSISRAKGLFHCFFSHTVSLGPTSHENILADPWIQNLTHLVPHGLYCFPASTRSREEMRRQWNIPEDVRVWLSFGHIRDGKNLDRVIEALAEVPHDYLWVVGREQSAEQKPVEFYQAFAEKKGIADRCRWTHEHVPEEEVGNYFEASDGVLLTYSKDFHSSSGVLSHAVHFRRPVIVSGGEGPLLQEVKDYHLGKIIESESSMALREAMLQWSSKDKVAEWDRYERDHSWDENAKRVLASMEKI